MRSARALVVSSASNHRTLKMPYKNKICMRGATCHFARSGKCTYAHPELGDKIGEWCPRPIDIRNTNIYEVLPDNTLYVQWFGHSSGNIVRLYCKGLTGPPCFSQNANVTLTPDDEKRCLHNIRHIVAKVKTAMRIVAQVNASKFEQDMLEDGMLQEKPPVEPQYPPKSRAMFKADRSGFERSLDCFGGQPPSSLCFFTPKSQVQVQS